MVSRLDAYRAQALKSVAIPSWSLMMTATKRPGRPRRPSESIEIGVFAGAIGESLAMVTLMATTHGALALLATAGGFIDAAALVLSAVPLVYRGARALLPLSLVLVVLAPLVLTFGIPCVLLAGQRDRPGHKAVTVIHRPRLQPSLATP
jgi:hypothetical protein